MSYPRSITSQVALAIELAGRVLPACELSTGWYVVARVGARWPFATVIDDIAAWQRPPRGLYQ